LLFWASSLAEEAFLVVEARLSQHTKPCDPAQVVRNSGLLDSAWAIFSEVRGIAAKLPYNGLLRCWRNWPASDLFKKAIVPIVVSMNDMFKKILIANRGEIAVRVLRACRELGIRSAAVYSDVDRASLHVTKADEAYYLGPPPAAESYLNISKILEVAKRVGADAIHPGYGFLSENPRFARACEEAGIKFIGPTGDAMETMGSKTGARRAMEKAGIPFVPGSLRGLASLEEAEQVAKKIGYPVMLKAASGGGGKGMRLVMMQSELRSALEGAKSEAARSFGDDEVYLEKAILRPRHIEMQILADEHGHTVYLGERECSIQRRHQKVLEEAPSAIVDPEMRRRMGEVAVRVAQAASYTNAGTVEFLVDGEKNFYFLEMNTRLQVEHPVTELITGLDLVHLQILIASGGELPFRQEDLTIRGHAIECRIYAEDPDNEFFPSPGKITMMLPPAGPGIRHDSGSYEGWTVPIDYDPLLAKLIAYGSDRKQATMRLQRALQEYFVGGIRTNVSLFQRILRDPDFLAARLDTGYLERLLAQTPEWRTLAPRSSAGEQSVEGGSEIGSEVAAIAAALFAVLDPAAARNGTSPVQDAVAGEPSDRPSRERSTNWKLAAFREALRN
jgi:acetyl-CoA carboxylase biotin carboxylase subunit